MKKIAILANQSSGQELAILQTFGARSTLWGWQCNFFFPDSVLQLQTITTNLNPNEYEAIVVVGGDGTINQVIRSFKNRPNEIPILPFPGGTANDLAKELGIEANWHQVQTLIDLKTHTLIDLIEINGIPFVTVGGIGIGSHLTQEFNELRTHSKKFKRASQFLHSQVYTLLTLKTIVSKNDYIHRVRISAPGYDEQIRTAALFICNQNYLGGTIQVAPPLDNADQRFNILIVTPSTKAKLLTAIAQLKAGKLPSQFFVFSSNQVNIIDLDQRKIPVFGDGERLVESKELEVKIRPKSLRVYRDTRNKQVDSSAKKTWDKLA